MCVVFLKYNPKKAIKLLVVFNRDESIRRERTMLDIHFAPAKILCGIDKEALGTWLGINLETGNFGFLTNYVHQPFVKIYDPAYRKGNLLMNFLKLEKPMLEQSEYQQYLDLFLKEGHSFNGTNLFLSNVRLDEMKFASNYSNEVQSRGGDNEMVSVANGKIDELWGKEKLGKQMINNILDKHDGDEE